jgi:hypothetical protein
MNKLEKPNGLIIRIVKEDGGSYIYLYDMIGERVTGNGKIISHDLHGTMPTNTMIFVKYDNTDDGNVLIDDIMPVEFDTDILTIMKNNDFIPLVEEVYMELFESDLEVKVK